LKEKFEDTKAKVKSLETELQGWMDRKAEPNLIEVERKNKRFKLKW
jgi:hypothetical protein